MAVDQKQFWKAVGEKGALMYDTSDGAIWTDYIRDPMNEWKVYHSKTIINVRYVMDYLGKDPMDYKETLKFLESLPEDVTESDILGDESDG